MMMMLILETAFKELNYFIDPSKIKFYLKISYRAGALYVCVLAHAHICTQSRKKWFLMKVVVLFQSLVCLNGDIIRKDTINAMVPGNAKFLMDSVFELAQRLNHFRLSDAEIGLFCAVVIITPGMCTYLSLIHI